MVLTDEEQSLLIVALLFIAAVALWAWVLHVRGRMLIRSLSEKLEPELWQELGAPASIQEAMRDPQKRWHRFIRGREYRNRCSQEVVDLIDDYRHRGNRMMIILGVAGLALLIRYWPLLKPDFL